MILHKTKTAAISGCGFSMYFEITKLHYERLLSTYHNRSLLARLVHEP